MKILTSEVDMLNLTSRDLIRLECEHCKKEFNVKKHLVQWAVKRKDIDTIRYCNRKCRGESQKIKIRKLCKNCNEILFLIPSVINKSKSGNYFCSKSCAVTYNNKNKKFGTRRSKLENYLEEQLKNIYPSLEIHYNQKNQINSELDIYIPSLKLAFELNGIFHYEAIFGDDKLSKIKNNDVRKFQACLEKNIELCIIDTSKLKYFKEQNAKEYLDIILNILLSKMRIE